MSIRLGVVFLLVCFCVPSRATAEVRCANAKLSGLAKVIYVSPGGKDDAVCGQTISSACKTIQVGIERCTGENCGVLVRYGTYNTGSAIKVADGVSLYGSCVFDETTYRYRSTIMGNPAIEATGINKPTVLEGFVILGTTSLNAGQASVAVVISNTKGLVFRDNVIASGPGAKGANGNTPTAGTGEVGGAASLTIGGAGGRACPVDPPPASAGSGGKGANMRPITSSCNGPKGECDCGDRPEAPRPVGANGANSGSVSGGTGGQAGTPGCACFYEGRQQRDAGTGADGAPGKMGDFARQGGSANPDTKGSFNGATWRPNSGGAGAAGQVGSGGGGGGAGGFSALTDSGSNRNGYGGGGGGGGGCGGPGGTGAQQGGASIPLVLFASSMAQVGASNVVIPGPGGQGGQGGTGALGGTGGLGGAGFKGDQVKVTQRTLFNAPIAPEKCSGLVPGLGGKGGNGGQGGVGAGGAGGNGGPSFGIALVNSSSVPASNFIIYEPQPGAGGAVGSGGPNNETHKGEKGKDGFSDKQNSIVSFTSTTLAIGANQ